MEINIHDREIQHKLHYCDCASLKNFDYALWICLVACLSLFCSLLIALSSMACCQLMALLREHVHFMDLQHNDITFSTPILTFDVDNCAAFYSHTLFDSFTCRRRKKLVKQIVSNFSIKIEHLIWPLWCLYLITLDQINLKICAKKIFQYT